MNRVHRDWSHSQLHGEPVVRALWSDSVHRGCDQSQRTRFSMKWGQLRWREIQNKKHLKNVGPIRHCEPPHAHSPGVASGTVARRLRIDVHDIDNDDNDNAWQRGPLWPHGMGPSMIVVCAGWSIDLVNRPIGCVAYLFVYAWPPRRRRRL